MNKGTTIVIPSGFQELEVRRGNESYGVNIHMKLCMCRMWQLSGVPCVYSVASYMHMNSEPDEGVDHWYNQKKWFEAYQFSIKPVGGGRRSSGGRVGPSGGRGEPSSGRGESSHMGVGGGKSSHGTAGRGAGRGGRKCGANMLVDEEECADCE
ncbi:hypothetical protein CTI12_AA098650 [Artemisia annua]|uniref:Zinc finger PMZ-type domain-containing protein n=1 Tax=Artemisia annua TaxID=35608 RepID=A0A2U1PY63_ARTAN|nr:hypothetical protein CTI12_AA098650 [Artemisia annua]